MNGKKAKALRRAVYGDQSIKSPSYVEHNIKLKSEIEKLPWTSTIICKGLREEYKKAKKNPRDYL
jgi:hypothetical protein